MRRCLIGAALAAFVLAANADLIGVAPAGLRTVHFYSEQGDCPDGMQRAELVEPKGEAVPGCFRVHVDGRVVVILIDGRVAEGHVSMIRPPKTT